MTNETGLEFTIPDDEPDGVAFNPLGSGHDPVNNPEHYLRDGIEVIKVIKAFLTPEEYKGYLKGTQIAYLLRSPWKKAENQDIKKAGVYAKWLVEEIE